MIDPLEPRVMLTTTVTLSPQYRMGWLSDVATADRDSDSHQTGFDAGAEFRGFFTFDTSDLPDRATVIAAELETRQFVSAGPAPYEIGLFDVSTSAFRLNRAEAPDPAIFDDLGTGERYGTLTIAAPRNSYADAALGEAALRTIEDAWEFSIGMRLMNASAAIQYAFGDSAYTGGQALHVSYRLPPTGITLSNASVLEDQPAGTLIGTLSATDPDGDADTFRLLDDADGRFVIVGNELRTARPINRERDPEPDVRVVVTDADGAAYARTFPIAIGNIEERPIILDDAFGVDEDASAGALVGYLTAYDRDFGDRLAFDIVDGNADGAFAVRNRFNGIGLEVADPSGLDFETEPIRTLTIRATDDSAAQLSATATIEVRVRDVAEPLAEPATVTGRVLADRDGDGRIGPGDAPEAGALVDLHHVGTDGLFGTADDVWVDSTATAADGSYTLASSVLGRHAVRVRGDRFAAFAPAGIGDEAGGSDVGADGVSDPVLLTSGQTVTLDALGTLPAEPFPISRLPIGGRFDDAPKGRSTRPDVSDDGRFVVFVSDSRRLAADGSVSGMHVYVRDRLTGAIELIDVASDGAVADCGVSSDDAPRISGDGRFVVFESHAENLVPGLPDLPYFVGRIFVRDRVAGTTELISVADDGTLADSSSRDPVISDDGRFVAFDSEADNLVAGDANGQRDVFLRDRQAGTTVRVSVAADGTESDGRSEGAAISDDGRFVAYLSSARNLTSDAVFGRTDAFVFDRLAGSVALVSADNQGEPVRHWVESVAISGDGRTVGFITDADGLVAGDTNGRDDVFVRDLDAGDPAAGNPGTLAVGRIEAVSVDSRGVFGSGFFGFVRSERFSLSDDGRRVAFASVLDGLIPHDSDGEEDVFVRDRDAGTTRRVGVDSYGRVSDYGTEHPMISGDGGTVVFVSDLLSDRPTSFADEYVLARDLAARRTEHISAALPSHDLRSTVNAIDLTPDGRFVAFGAGGGGSLFLGGDGGPLFVHDRLTGAFDPVDLRDGDGTLSARSDQISISDDGRLVAFAASTTFFGQTDIYVRDRVSGALERISLGIGGAAPDGRSTEPILSGDGRFVVFYSEATNLVAGDANGLRDIFVHDRQAGTTERINVRADGSELTEFWSFSPSISRDGRLVAFAAADEIADDDTNGGSDVYVRDLVAGTLRRVTHGRNGEQANGTTGTVALSGDGHHVAYFSTADNLVAGDTNAARDAFVTDLRTGRTERVSVATGGGQASGDSRDNFEARLAISDDGRFVTFLSTAPDLVAGDANGEQDLFLHDRAGRVTERLSRAFDGSESAARTHRYGGYDTLAISGQGELVAFIGEPDSLIPRISLTTRTGLLIDRTGNITPTVGPETFTIAEQSPGGTLVGVVVGDPGEAGQRLTYRIAGGTGEGLFAIDPLDGTIRVATGAAIDFEAAATLDLIVAATDDGTLSQTGTATVTIHLTDVANEPLVDRVSASVRYVENRNPAFFARSARVRDPDTADFGGAVLQVDLVGDDGRPLALPEDRVGLIDGGGVVSGTSDFGQGDGLVRIAVAGAGLVAIADATYDGASMTLTFRSGATAAQIAQVLRRAAYRSDSESPDLTPRRIRVRLTDPDGHLATDIGQNHAAVRIVSVADPTRLDGFASPTWTEGGGPVRFAPADGQPIAVSDLDTDDFGGSRLDVIVRTPRDAGDRFLLDHAADAAVTVSDESPGGTVAIDGRAVATLPRGVAANRLVLDFLAGATAADVSRLAGLIAFDSGSDAPRGPKQVRFGLSGADGARGAALVTLAVAPTNDAPAIANVAGQTVSAAAGGPAVRLAGRFALVDPDAAPGGVLRVAAVGLAAALQVDADPSGRLVLSGSDIVYRGAVVGSVAGLGTASLTATFNAGSSVAAVRSFGRLIGLAAESAAMPGLYDIAWDWTDDAGAAAPTATMQVEVAEPTA